MKQLLCLLLVGLSLASVVGIACSEDKREEKPRFKGVELYSWKDKNNGWVFVLLNGTNIIKPEEQIKAPQNQIKGVADLKKALGKLAVGEEVFWNSPGNQGFKLPSKETRMEIQKAAEHAKIKLHVPDAKE